LLVVNNANTVIHRNQVLALAAKSHLAALYEYRDWTEAGGLMSYGPVISETWRQLAECVDKILKGAKPADVPVQQPSKFDLVINLKTAKALGLAIPPTLLQRAAVLMASVMERRTFLGVIAGSLLAAPLAAEAQPAGKVPRLCFLTFSPGIPLSTFDPFFQGLRDRGYVDGRPLPSTTSPQMARLRGFPPSPPTACDSRRTSSLQPPPTPLRLRRRQPAPSRSSCTPSATRWRAGSS